MAVSFVSVGAQSTGAGGTRGPALPASTVADDFLLGAFAARTDGGAYANPNAGWAETSGSPYSR